MNNFSPSIEPQEPQVGRKLEAFLGLFDAEILFTVC